MQQEKREESAAAAKIQARYRGKRAEKDLDSVKSSAPERTTHPKPPKLSLSKRKGVSFCLASSKLKLYTS